MGGVASTGAPSWTRSAYVPYGKLARGSPSRSNLRSSLSTEERALLALRVDRGIAWREVALTLAEEELGTHDLSRTEQALRKRFERLKAKVRVLAREHGLVGA